jgi:RimJ/RimL family protein N-acetyltransferase
VRSEVPLPTANHGKSDPNPSNPTNPTALAGAAAAPIVNIGGPTVCLGPPTRASVAIMARWDNDFAVTVLAGDPLRPKTLEACEADFDRHAKGDDHTWVDFLIYERATLRLIGVTGLRDISATQRSATLGICIGEKDCWGKGYGTEATILLLDYGFSVLGLHNVMLDTFSYNERAIRAYRRAGFREFGRRREAARLGTHVFDVVYMDCLASEFTSPLPSVLPPLEEPLARQEEPSQ